MGTTITTAANLGIAPIIVPDDMPRDELLLEMERFAAEADAQMGDWFPAGVAFKVRAWPNDRFYPSEVVEISHTRQRYSAEAVRALIAEDAKARK